MRILHLEDDRNDARLVQETLESEGIACNLIRVEAEAQFRASLEQGTFDLILADYTLPSFDGISALKLAKGATPEIPFIFVSGTLDEEVAIEALKLGATDYVFKTRLSRIAPAVRRAVREAEALAQRKLAVTGQEKLTQELQRRQAYLAEAQRLSQTGSWAWTPATGDITYWSEECFRVLGFDPKGPLPRFEEFLLRVHPDDRQPARELFEQAVLDKKDFELDYRIVHPDKGIRDIHAVGHSVLSASGDLIEFVGTVIDVTARKQAEEELQQLVDFVPQVIIVLGPDGKYIHVNRVAREYTGLTLDEYRSIDVLPRVIHPDDLEMMRKERQRGLLTDAPFESEARMLGKDGVYRWFLYRYRPLLERGRTRRWYVSAMEIESRKQEEERIRKENVRLEERTRIAQELHDTLLQTFLSATMQLGVAVDAVPEESPEKQRLDRILQIMNRGLEEGRSTIQGLRSDLRSADLVAALSAVQKETPGQSGIDFRIRVAGRQQPLNSSVQQEIYRIGREALLNAFSHSKAKRVEFELEYADRDLQMRVRDDGVGIDPQVIHEGRDGHWGLAGMRERAARIGGVLNISSILEGGTEVQLWIPNGLAFQKLSAAEKSA